jgi:hypothetical protein
VIFNDHLLVRAPLKHRVVWADIDREARDGKPIPSDHAAGPGVGDCIIQHTKSDSSQTEKPNDTHSVRHWALPFWRDMEFHHAAPSVVGNGS